MKPVNQKSVYSTAGALIEKMLNKEITVDEAEKGALLLSQMNRAFALEIKKAELERCPMRIIEVKAFDSKYE